MKKAHRLFLCVRDVMLTLAPAIIGQGTNVTQVLKARNAEFRKGVTKVTDGVYAVVGYSVSPVFMIMGDNGLIVIDTGTDTVSSEQVLADFRKITVNRS